MPQNIWNDIQKVYRKSIHHATVFRWYKMFSEGRVCESVLAPSAPCHLDCQDAVSPIVLLVANFSTELNFRSYDSLSMCTSSNRNSILIKFATPFEYPIQHTSQLSGFFKLLAPIVQDRDRPAEPFGSPFDCRAHLIASCSSNCNPTAPAVDYDSFVALTWVNPPPLLRD